ncbi:hypothetical protein CH330_06965 [candidate division WOR-3 bacterium JGI_Cruoil_03_51_56]|uniref:Uncharacterized protein n=1 Tax=candidate division WOR-3 bacterium JGI_Cruoil_03_51_56 TaxID=1973747 RepID=A0A235BS01_UNCW3|nr:MAG: hypothetical protein CH330_06965 [candidate division WOR-3 bacterium JGI_Cruoil_03_51_56]
MKKTFLFLVLTGLTLLSADTLDYGHSVLIVTTLQGEAMAQFTPEDLNSRALEVLKQASYDQDLTVGSFLGAHMKQARRLGRMTLETKRMNTKYRSDGMVSVDYEFPLTGSVLEQLLPKVGGGRLLGRVACPYCGQEWPKGKEVPDGVELVPYEDGNTVTYTGILIDARGLSYRPAFFPKVVTEQDDEVYGPGFTQAEELAEYGMVGYYKNRTEALVSERIGTDPLVVRALSVTGSNSCNLVVSDYDAARVHGSKANLELMAKCRVGLLVD